MASNSNGPATRAELTSWIAQDLAMHGESRWRPQFRITRGVLYYQRLLRQTEYWTHTRRKGSLSRVVAAVQKLRLRRLAERLGFEVPRHAIGPGLSIAHSGCLVISDEARIGARCRIHQGVTVGAASGGAPTIGDDVFIGPNAVIIGPVSIGNGAFIYPGAVCTVDVPEGHSAAGVPATVRPYDGQPWRPAAS